MESLTIFINEDRMELKKLEKALKTAFDQCFYEEDAKEIISMIKNAIDNAFYLRDDMNIEKIRNYLKTYNLI